MTPRDLEDLTPAEIMVATAERRKHNLTLAWEIAMLGRIDAKHWPTQARQLWEKKKELTQQQTLDQMLPFFERLARQAEDDKKGIVRTRLVPVKPGV